jgi:hypothetical protein
MMRGVRNGLFFLLLLMAVSPAWSQQGPRSSVDSVTVPVFQNVAIEFHAPDSTGRKPARKLIDNGRVIEKTVRLPTFRGPHRIWAELTIHPVAKDERNVHDRYDRAGSIRLAVPERPDIEVLRFITAYGGRTHHRVDVSYLSPVLKGRRTLRAFIDTWSKPAWTIDLSLHFVPDTTYDNPSWVEPVVFSESFNRQEMPDGVAAKTVVPSGLERVVLQYISTGHCTDGRDEDEFISKANVVSVDGRVVARFHPWRTDCRKFRDRNPYCARWTDGSWSSDYSRSGWCPGVEVTPTEFDVSDALDAGPHDLRFAIENMRPKDKDGHFGYWRVSACLVGWDHKPKLWRN